MSLFGVILVRILPHSRYYVSLCIRSECGKIRTRITPNKDTFHAVLFKRNGNKKSNSHQNLANIWVGKRGHETKKTLSGRHKEGSKALSEAVV